MTLSDVLLELELKLILFASDSCLHNLLFCGPIRLRSGLTTGGRLRPRTLKDGVFPLRFPVSHQQKRHIWVFGIFLGNKPFPGCTRFVDDSSPAPSRQTSGKFADFFLEGAVRVVGLITQSQNNLILVSSDVQHVQNERIGSASQAFQRPSFLLCSRLSEDGRTGSWMARK